MFWKLLFGKKEEKKEETKVPVPVIQETSTENHEDAKFVPLSNIGTKQHDDSEKGKITADMTIGELVKNYPGSEQILTSYGVHCVGCHANPFETISQGILGHGLGQDKLDELIKELNEKLAHKKETKKRVALVSKGKKLKKAKKHKK